jgi:hypothetical protein
VRAYIRGRSGALDGNLVSPRFDQRVSQPAAHLNERPFLLLAFHESPSDRNTEDKDHGNEHRRSDSQ